MSSSGHLVLVPEFFNIPAPTLAFDVLVHLATLVAVVGYFIRDVSKIVVSVVAPRRMSRQEVKYWRRLLLWLVIGSIPAGFAGFLLSDFFEDLFSSTLSVGVFLVVTSLLLWGADLALGRVNRQPAQLDKMRAADALVVGCFQALAIAPGLSRSGSTIAGRRLPGFRPADGRALLLLAQHPRHPGSLPFQAERHRRSRSPAAAGSPTYGRGSGGISGFVGVYLPHALPQEPPPAGVRHLHGALLGMFVIVLSVAARRARCDGQR